jgi:hypothetical protein
MPACFGDGVLGKRGVTSRLRAAGRETEGAVQAVTPLQCTWPLKNSNEHRRKSVLLVWRRYSHRRRVAAGPEAWPLQNLKEPRLKSRGASGGLSGAGLRFSA